MRKLDEAAGRADDELRLLLELLDLALDVRAADQAERADGQFRRLRELLRCLCNLHRELMRRREHDGLRLRFLRIDARKRRQEVCERLPRPRWRLHNEIAA